MPERVLYSPVPSVASQDNASPGQNIQATPGAFGGGEAAALQGLGAATGQAASVATDVAVQQQQRFNQVATDEAFTQLQSGYRDITYGNPDDPTKKGFYTMQGRAALDAYRPSNDALEATRMRIRGGLQNDAQRVAFDQMSRRYQTSTQEAMGRYTDQQSKTWGATVQHGVVTNQLQAISDGWNSTDTFDAAVDQGRKGAVRRIQEQYGMNADPAVIDEALLKFTSQAVTTRVLAMANTDPAGAAAWLKSGTVPASGPGDQNSGGTRRISIQQAVDAHTYATLLQHVQPKARAAQADGVADGVWTGATGGGGGYSGAVTPANIPPVVMERADKVRDGLISRGLSPAVSVGLAANAVQESGANPATEPGDGGISHGLFQWNKERLDRFKAKYGVLPGQATLDQQLDFTVDELNTTERRAGDALKGASTPEEAAKIASTMYLRPKDTVNEEPRRAGIAAALGRRSYSPPGSAAGGTAAPDMSRMTQQILDMHLDPEVEHAALSRLQARHSTWQMTTATQRDTITRQFSDTKLALEAGKDDVEIPEVQIRSVFPPPKAEDMIQELQVSRMAGQLFKGVQWGTPEDLASARSDLATGQGRLSAMLRLRGRQVSGGGEKADAVGAEESPDQFGMRQRMLAKFDLMADARRTALEKDPAGYVAQAPAVQAAAVAAQANPQDPAAGQNVLNAMTTAQRQLGVPEYNQRVLTNADVERNVRTIASIDPEKGDIGLQLDQMARNYGTLWPKAFGEMVRVGKLAPEYQVIAAMTEPGQVSARADMQRALLMSSQHGGVEKMKAAAPQGVVTDIDRNVDASLDAFRQTTARNEGGAELFATVKNSVKLLAYRYAFQGQSSGEAIEHAITGVIDAKYDMQGTMRVPKGTLPQVTDATDYIQRGLTGADLAEIPGNPRLTQEERQQEVATAVRRGSWVPNSDDTGLVLMMPLASGMRVARRRDGSAVEVKFNNLPAVPTPDADTKTPAMNLLMGAP